MMLFGLLGRRLGHTYSPQIHSYFGNYPYVIFEREPDEIVEFMSTSDFSGINVTIPYKKAVIPYLHDLSPIARRLGSVNTVVRRDGKLIGHNTDYYGFSSMLRHTGLQMSGKKVLVLGSGGASNTVSAVLGEFGANVVVISRTGENNYGNLHLHSNASVIVNTTPVGMYPDTMVSPVDLSLFPKLEGGLDLIYNPCRTKLLMDAAARGLVAMSGLWMLIAQAKESAEWFTGKTIRDSVIPQIYDQLRLQMENIILIGMPGCGKTTVAKLLGQRLNRIVVDADCEIETEIGCTIPEFFRKYGEDAFRTVETQVLQRIGKESGLIIATGGGCVTRKENYPLLHQNGRIFWLTRDISMLPTEGRPLSQNHDLYEMYKRREPMYAYFADHMIDNSATPEETAQAIRRLL